MSPIKKITQLLKGKDSNLIGQILRYLISGGTAFLIDMGTMIAFCEVLGVREAIAASIGNFMGLVFTYILSICWIFDQRKYKNHVLEFLIFFLIGIGGTLITYGLMIILVEKFNIYYVFSKVVTVIIVAAYAFIAKKILLFRKSNRT